MPHPAVLDIAPREKILDAAEGLFARRGFAGVGLSEVAEAVGLGKSSLFHHFKSKVELYAAVLGRIFEEMEAASRACSRPEATRLRVSIA